MPFTLLQRKPSVWLGHTLRPFAFATPAGGAPFALLIAAGEDTITPDERDRLASAFIQQGCRYAVCCGHDCAAWEEAVDRQAIPLEEQSGNPDFDVPTTQHAGESLEEVAAFFVQCTVIDQQPPATFIVLLVGGDDAYEAAVRKAIVAEFDIA